MQESVQPRKGDMKNVIITVCAALLVAVPATIGLVGNTSFSQTVPVRPPANASFVGDSNEPATAPTPSPPTTTAPSTSDDKGGQRSTRTPEPEDNNGGQRGSRSPQRLDDGTDQSGKSHASGASELSRDGSGIKSSKSLESIESIESSKSLEGSPSAPPRTADDNVATPARTGDDKVSSSGSGKIAGITESDKNGNSSSGSDVTGDDGSR